MEVEDKISEMQKYIPCLKLLIENLDKNPDKEAQVKKMQYLLEMLTKKDSSIKLETLVRCEGILMKVYGKEQMLLNNSESNGVKDDVVKIMNDKEKINSIQEDSMQPTQEKIFNGSCSNNFPKIVSVAGNQTQTEQDDNMKNSDLNGKDVTSNMVDTGSNNNEKSIESQTDNDSSLFKDNGNRSCVGESNLPTIGETLNGRPQDSKIDVVNIDGKSFNLVEVHGENCTDNDSKQPENLDEDGECNMDIDEELTNLSLSKTQMDVNTAEVQPNNRIDNMEPEHVSNNMTSVLVPKPVEATSVEAKSNVVDLTSDDSNDESPTCDRTPQTSCARHPAPFEPKVVRPSGNLKILSCKPPGPAAVVFIPTDDKGSKVPVTPPTIIAPKAAAKKGNSNKDPLGDLPPANVATIVLDSDSDDDNCESSNENASKRKRGSLPDPNGAISMPTPKLVKPIFTISSVQSMSTYQAQQEKRLEVEKELQVLVKDSQTSSFHTVPKKYSSCVRVYLQNFIKDLMFEKNRVNLCLQKLQKTLVSNKYKQVKKIIQTFCSEPVSDPSLPPPSPFCHRIKVYPEKLQFVMNQLFFINREISVIGYKVYGLIPHRPQLQPSSDSKAPLPRKAQPGQPPQFDSRASEKIYQSLKVVTGKTINSNLTFMPASPKKTTGQSKKLPTISKNPTATSKNPPANFKMTPVNTKTPLAASKNQPATVVHPPSSAAHSPSAAGHPPSTAVQPPSAAVQLPAPAIQTVYIPTLSVQSNKSLSLSPPSEDLLAPMKTQSVPIESPSPKPRRRKRRSDDDDEDDDEDDENYVPQGNCSESDESTDSTNETTTSRRKSLQRASKLRCQKYLELERAIDDETFLLATETMQTGKSRTSNANCQPPAKKSKSAICPKKEPLEIEGGLEETNPDDEETEDETEVQNMKASKNSRNNAENDQDMDINDDYEEESSSDIHFSAEMKLRNVHRAIHCRSKYTERCLICNERLHKKSTIAHYVNNHGNREVFVSRITKSDVLKLQSETMSFAFLSAGKSAVSTYVAYCIFCQQEQCLSLKNWWEHYTRHTGEYVYGCTGCTARRSCRQQLNRHIKQECSQKGSALVELHETDPKMNRINAYVCFLCNYIQLAEMGMIKHLKNEHEFPGSAKELPEGVYQIVNLLKIDQNLYGPEIEQEEERFAESLEESNTEDVSFMICNMLASGQEPVQQNAELTATSSEGNHLTSETTSEHFNENRSQSPEMIVPECIPAYHLERKVAGEDSKVEVKEKKVEVKIERANNQDNITYDKCALKIRQYMNAIDGSTQENQFPGVVCKKEKIEGTNESLYPENQVDVKPVLNDDIIASQSEKNVNEHTSVGLNSSTNFEKPVVIEKDITNDSNVSSNVAASDDDVFKSFKAPGNTLKCEAYAAELKYSAEARTTNISNASSAEEELTLFATEKILQQVSTSLINYAYDSMDVSIEASSGLPETTTISSESTSEMPESVADSVESGPEFLNPSDVASVQPDLVAAAKTRVPDLLSAKDCKDVEREEKIDEGDERGQIQTVTCTVDDQVESILPDLETNKVAESIDDVMGLTDETMVISENGWGKRKITSAIVVKDSAGDVFEIVELTTETTETNDCVVSSVTTLENETFDSIVPDSVVDNFIAVETMVADEVALDESMVDPMEADLMETDAIVDDIILNNAMDAEPVAADTLRADVDVAAGLNDTSAANLIEPDLVVNPVITDVLPADSSVADAEMQDLESTETVTNDANTDNHMMTPKTTVASSILTATDTANLLASDSVKTENEVFNAEETS